MSKEKIMELIDNHHRLLIAKSPVLFDDRLVLNYCIQKSYERISLISRLFKYLNP